MICITSKFQYILLFGNLATLNRVPMQWHLLMDLSVVPVANILISVHKNLSPFFLDFLVDGEP